MPIIFRQSLSSSTDVIGERVYDIIISFIKKMDEVKSGIVERTYGCVLIEKET